MGDSLEILFPPQAASIVQQFQTEIADISTTSTTDPETEITTTTSTAKVRVASGAAIIAGQGQAVSGEGTKEWYLKHFAVFPTGARTTGTNSASPFASQGGTVTITNGATEGGSDTWWVSLVANNYDASGSESAYPMLAVMAEGSDAYTKSSPFNYPDDTRYKATFIRTSSVSVTQADGSVVYGYLYDSVGTYLQNYNCQRLQIAKIHWTGSAWEVTQYLYGPVTFTNDLKIGAPITLVDGDPVPDTGNASQQADWVGSWSGYTKDPSGDVLVTL